MSLVKVYNEWDPIEEIIVGNAKYANLPGNGDLIFQLTLDEDEYGKEYDTAYPFTFPKRIIEETTADIENIINEFKKLKIVTKTPIPISAKNKIRTLDWETEHYFCYCPRDLFIAIDDMIIECPTAFRSRYFESFSYQHIMLEYMKSGARWIAAPKPRLEDISYNNFKVSQGSILNNNEPIFDAANVLRAGRDIFYLVSDSGNELGHIWLQNILGRDYRVHPCRNIYSGVHIDTTICLLRPGLVLVNPKVNLDNLPSILKKWDIITAPEMVEVNYSNIRPMASNWLGMNLLMLSPNLAMVDKHQAALIKLLENKGIDVIPILLRHGRTLGGGPHCITLDVRRKGTLENYFQ